MGARPCLIQKLNGCRKAHLKKKKERKKDALLCQSVSSQRRGKGTLPAVPYLNRNKNRFLSQRGGPLRQIRKEAGLSVTHCSGAQQRRLRTQIDPEETLSARSQSCEQLGAAVFGLILDVRSVDAALRTTECRHFELKSECVYIWGSLNTDFLNLFFVLNQLVKKGTLISC